MSSDHLLLVTAAVLTKTQEKLNVGSHRHLDDTTGAGWRKVTISFCCFIMSVDTVTSYFNCVGFGCNAVYPWNSRSVLLTQTLHPPPPPPPPPSIDIVLSRSFSVNCPFELYETNCDLWIWAIQIKWDLILHSSMEHFSLFQLIVFIYDSTKSPCIIHVFQTHHAAGLRLDTTCPALNSSHKKLATSRRTQWSINRKRAKLYLLGVGGDQNREARSECVCRDEDLFLVCTAAPKWHKNNIKRWCCTPPDNWLLHMKWVDFAINEMAWKCVQFC